MEDINNTANMSEENKQEFFFANGVQNNSFVKDNLRKVGIFVVLLNIFYPIGWHYKQWKAIKNNNEEYKNISPFWRGVFYPFYAFKLTQIIKELFEIKKDIDLRTITDEEELKKVKKEHKINFAIWPYIIWGSILFLFIFYFSPDSDLDKLLGAIAWILIYLPIHNLQHAINYIMPKETKEKVFSLSDLLGVPFFALLLAFFFFGIGGQSCLKVNGNTLKNTCENYSFSFPFGNNELFAVGDKFGNKYICQAEDANNTEDNLVCIEGFYLDEQAPFDQNKIEQGIAVKMDIISKRTETYNGNLAYCFGAKSKENPTMTIQNICYIRMKEKPGLAFFISDVAKSKEMPFENLEKLMNSYKSW